MAGSMAVAELYTEEDLRGLHKYFRSNPESNIARIPNGEYFVTFCLRYDFSLGEAKRDARVGRKYWDPKDKKKTQRIEREEEYWRSIRDDFLKFVDDKTDEGIPVTRDLAVDGYSGFVDRCGGINNAKIAIRRPKLVHGNNHKGLVQDAHRKSKVKPERRVYRTFYKKRMGKVR